MADLAQTQELEVSADGWEATPFGLPDVEQEVIEQAARLLLDNEPLSEAQARRLLLALVTEVQRLTTVVRDEVLEP